MDLPSATASVSLQTFLVRLIWLCMGPLLLLALWLAYAHVADVRGHQRADAVQLAAGVAATIDQEIGARIATLTALAESTHLDSESGLAQFYALAQGFRKAFPQTHLAVVDHALCRVRDRLAAASG